MEPEIPLPCSQEPTSVSNPEPDKSNPYIHTLFLEVQFNIILPSKS
jgi:hypothetical protein